MTAIDTLPVTRQRICPNCDTPADASFYSLPPRSAYVCLRCGFRAAAEQWPSDDIETLN
jgi:hypothetical protein